MTNGVLVQIECHMGNKADIAACLDGKHPHCERVRMNQLMKRSRELGRAARAQVERKVFQILTGMEEIRT